MKSARQVLNEFWKYIESIDPELSKLRYTVEIKQLYELDYTKGINSCVAINGKYYEYLKYTAHDDLPCEIRTIFSSYIDDQYNNGEISDSVAFYITLGMESELIKKQMESNILKINK